MPSTAELPGVPDAEATVVARVMADHPSAVLLVDLDTRTVVYTNAIARQLAPQTDLPVDVDRWATSAGLRTTSGDELGETATPLHDVAEGVPVNGELVTARRGSDITAAREDLWVIGIPLTDAPEPLGRRALVVIFPVRDVGGRDAAGATGMELRHRAVISSQLSFSISDPNREDNPIVWVNPAFERATGYSSEDVIGRNCRFLQGPLTDRATVGRISEGLRNDGFVDETILNYRADGTMFWNHLVISPVHDADGNVTHHVGIQNDVTDRIASDEARDAALASARAANDRLATQAVISQSLSERLADNGDLLTELPGILAERLDGWIASVGLTGGRVGPIAVAHGHDTHPDPAISDEQRVRLLHDWFTGPAATAIEAARHPARHRWPMVWTLGPDEVGQLLTEGDDTARPGRTGDDLSIAVSPMPGRGTVMGLLANARYAPFDDPAELTALADLGRRAGLALDNARLYAREHEVALTLQRSLLPTLPDLASFDVAADYIASSAAADVGGDWYDVLDLPGPWVGVAVGDVMGHDMTAAAAMGQLRSMVRTLAWAGARPGELITRLDELVRGFDSARMATFLYAFLDDPAHHDGVCTVHYTSAGHPPAVLKHADGRTELLDGAITAPIGVRFRRTPTPQATADLPVGASLILYTDGLIERRDRGIDESIDTLVDLVATIPADATADEMRGRIADALVSPDHADDTCLLVVRRAG